MRTDRNINCLLVLLGVVAACGTPQERPRDTNVPAMVAPFPAWVLGAWSREWIERGGKQTSPAIVRYVQSPGAFGDVRLPLDRPKFPRANSFADLTDADLRALTRQRGFFGHTTADGAIATWHHELDFQPPDSGTDAGHLERSGTGAMFEHGLDGSYTEHWWSLTSGDGHFLVVRVERDGRLDRMLVVAGDYFAYARNRAKDLPAAPSIDSLIARTHATRAEVIAYLDCEMSIGRVRGGTTPWEIQFSTLPWREGRRLDFVDGIHAGANGALALPAAPGETWTAPLNSLDGVTMRVLFPPLRIATP